MTMREVQMTMISGDKIKKVKITVDYESKLSPFDEDGNITINLANVQIQGLPAGPEEVFIAKAVDEYIDIIRDFIIEGLTDCYVEYDENGKEMFIPKSK